jgi:hypothetical protein
MLVQVHAIIFFDIAAIMAMLVVATLSKTIGEPLKIPPYYKLLYGASALLAAAALMDIVPPTNTALYVPAVFLMGMRCLAGLIAIPVCQRYWKFLISEYFKN